MHLGRQRGIDLARAGFGVLRLAGARLVVLGLRGREPVGNAALVLCEKRVSVLTFGGGGKRPWVRSGEGGKGWNRCLVPFSDENGRVDAQARDRRGRGIENQASSIDLVCNSFP